ncbi:MAG: LytR C-terminal domain-containing protein [Terrimesophilobacter sp.]
MAIYPHDRFDELPDDLLRRGAHRASPRKGRGWIAVLWAVVATMVLVAGGLMVLSLITNRDNPFTSQYISTPGTSASATPSGTPTAEAKLDPNIPLTILNGTTVAKLANQVGDKLAAEGWGGADEGVGSRLSASRNNVEKTVVFYSDPANEGAARALVASLKVGEVRLSNDYPASPITVLLGSDYKPGA